MDHLALIILVVYSVVFSGFSVILILKNNNLKDKSLQDKIAIYELEHKLREVEKKNLSLVATNKDLQNKLSSYKEKLAKISEMFNGAK